MNRFDADPEVFDRFPGMQLVVAVVDGLDNRAERPAVATFWQEAWAGVRSLELSDGDRESPE